MARQTSEGARRRIMQSIRSTDSKAELELRRALWRRGLHYRLHAPGVIGRPDIVFQSVRLAVFVDGDFWHGRVLIDRGRGALIASFREANLDYWLPKIEGNVARDRRVTAELEAQGWNVLRLWELDIRADVERAATLVMLARSCGRPRAGAVTGEEGLGEQKCRSVLLSQRLQSAVSPGSGS